MPSSSSSSSVLLLLLLLPRPGAAEDANCGDPFRAGQENFVLDAEDAVLAGAALLAAAHARTPVECERACCAERRCNLALLEPRGGGAFVNLVGYRTFIRDSVFQKHLRGPQPAVKIICVTSLPPGEQAPPIAIAGRDVIVQPGATVTLNGIESLPLGNAHITDYQWTLQSGHDSVKMEKTELPDQVRLSNLQNGSYVFQLTVTDSNDQSHAAKVTVLVLSPELTGLYCQAPSNVGPCRAAFPRWHYDAAAGDCDSFVFGGCKGNNNNFLSKHECLSACRGVTVISERSVAQPTAEVCGSPCSAGQLTCGSGCCLDRSLECDGQQHCSDGSDEDHCNKLNQTFSHLLDIDVNQKKARCSEPPNTGPCRASLTRWFYDPMNRKCARFTYGGCNANGNNFEEEKECSAVCDGVTERSVYFKGLFDRFEKEEDSESGHIALAVLLLVVILAVLAIITYCFLKSRKARSHRPVDTGPAHVVLSEQETLVYNSTTRPI
uniref:BPTI/Kunitz inhibitor domain-containing protein n=1 Tax=Mola mola TaxID=94237 RepID=A0A3Q3XJF3_MOLML